VVTSKLATEPAGQADATPAVFPVGVTHQTARSFSPTASVAGQADAYKRSLEFPSEEEAECFPRDDSLMLTPSGLPPRANPAAAALGQAAGHSAQHGRPTSSAKKGGGTQQHALSAAAVAFGQVKEGSVECGSPWPSAKDSGSVQANTLGATAGASSSASISKMVCPHPDCPAGVYNLKPHNSSRVLGFVCFAFVRQILAWGCSATPEEVKNCLSVPFGKNDPSGFMICTAMDRIRL
jgi:hypothetical protein